MVLCRAGHCEAQRSCCMVDSGSPYFSSLSLAVSIHLYFAILSAVKLKQDLRAVPLKGWGSQWFSLHFLSWHGELFLAGTFSLGTEQCQLGGRVDLSNMKLACFSSCAVLLRFFVHYVAKVS